MNDFTKEELGLILEVYEDLRFSLYHREDLSNLRKKIQSMIDNYCECDDDVHEFVSSESVVYGSPLYRCKYCWKIK